MQLVHTSICYKTKYGIIADSELRLCLYNYPLKFVRIRAKHTPSSLEIKKHKPFRRTYKVFIISLTILLLYSSYQEGFISLVPKFVGIPD